MAQGILRPLTYGDLFDELFDLYKKNFVLFVGISAVVQIPVYVIAYAIGGTSAAAIASVLNLIATYFVLAATTHAVSQVYLGNKITIAEAYRAIRRSVWPLFLNMLVAGLRILGGLILLIIPGVILSLRYAFVAQVFILEGQGGADGRDRSIFLSKDNMGRIFMVGLLVGILTSIVSWILAMPLALLIPSMASNPQAMAGPMGTVNGIAQGVIIALTNPLQVIAMVLLYYDIRVRKEGFDIQMLASNMGMALPAATVAATEPKPTDLTGSL